MILQVFSVLKTNTVGSPGAAGAVVLSPDSEIDVGNTNDEGREA